MIEATFIKAVPLKDGTISYMLSGPRTKEALRLAVDLQDEKCSIALLQAAEPVAYMDMLFDALRPVLSAFMEEKFREGQDSGRILGMIMSEDQPRLDVMDKCVCGHFLEQHSDPDFTGMLFCTATGCKCHNFARPGEDQPKLPVVGTES